MDPQGVLGRQGRYDAHPEAPQNGDGLQIRLDSGTAAGIGTGNGQYPLYPFQNDLLCSVRPSGGITGLTIIPTPGTTKDENIRLFADIFI